MRQQSTNHSEMLMRADVYTATGRLVKSFDVTAVPVHSLDETLRKAMGNKAKQARVVRHPEGVERGECVGVVDKNGPSAFKLDEFNSRRAFTGRTW